MVLAWDFKDRRESVSISIKPISYLLGNLRVLSDDKHSMAVATLSPYMLVDKQDSNIFSVMRISVECLLDCRCLRLRVDD